MDQEMERKSSGAGGAPTLCQSALCHCGRILERNNLRGEIVYFGSQFPPANGWEM
jgi:hypothetical protein